VPVRELAHGRTTDSDLPPQDELHHREREVGDGVGACAHVQARQLVQPRELGAARGAVHGDRLQLVEYVIDRDRWHLDHRSDRDAIPPV